MWKYIVTWTLTLSNPCQEGTTEVTVKAEFKDSQKAREFFDCGNTIAPNTMNIDSLIIKSNFNEAN